MRLIKKKQYNIINNKEKDSIMANEILQTFVSVIKKYYPEEEIGIENNHVWANGYLAGLLRSLIRKGYGDKFIFIKYLIEHVKYTEALETTHRFIDDLLDIGIIYKDPVTKDLYRVTETGLEIFGKIEIDIRRYRA